MKEPGQDTMDFHSLTEDDQLTLTREEIEDLEFPAAQPPTVTYAGQDFDVEGLVRRLDRGDIVIPSFGETADDIETAGFQRGFVWRKPQMDRFVESLLLGFPIPGIFLVRQGDGRMLVLDGQQRLRTLSHFYDGLFSGREFSLNYVSETFRGLTYRNLPAELRRKLDNTFMQTVIVTAQPDADNMDAIYQIFERLNSGGTQLTAHEIRVALFAGPIIEYLETLNRSPDWRQLYGRKNKRIRDQELVARILALFLHSDEYSRPLKTFINKFLEANRNGVRDETRQAGELFLQASSLLSENFGEDALRRASKQVNNAWTDGLYFGIMKRLSQGPLDVEELKSGYDSLRKNEEFQRFSTSSSADEQQVKQRLQIAEESFGTK
ncbi:DUF262 domain-containing protein [Corynebacterium sp. UBA2622]|uniref:DUF262 domain-containing protein n=1 Tax=Corynebacterium sp. UBA2622 TaxID=1946393 RepID=UPI0025B8805D|nr:DUF262 domain-containing protein [Corynebacterium sp. UBA2622]